MTVQPSPQSHSIIQFVVTNAKTVLDFCNCRTPDLDSIYRFLCWTALRYLRLKITMQNKAMPTSWWTEAPIEFWAKGDGPDSLGMNDINFNWLDDISQSDLLMPNALGGTIEVLLCHELRSEGDHLVIVNSGNRRKALGAFYTPKPLIDCVIEETVGPLLKDIVDNLPQDRWEAAVLNLRICDPACGAGYFLIAAAKKLALQLVEWAGDDAIYSDCLSAVTKKCVFGVDLEPLAIEAARTNLESQCRQPIPELDVHLRCGNALLDPSNQSNDTGVNRFQFIRINGRDSEDAFAALRKTFPKNSSTTPAKDEDAQIAAAELAMSSVLLPKVPTVLADFPTDDMWKMARRGQEIPTKTESLIAQVASQYQFFSWRSAFRAVFSQGGFDAVIGNPPFLDSTFIKKNQPELRSLIGNLFRSARGNWDLYIPFTELGLTLLKSNGLLGFVTPNKILASDYAAQLQSLLLSKYRIVSMHDYSDSAFFQDAQVPIVVTVVKAVQAHSADTVRCVRHGRKSEVYCQIGALRSFPKGYIALPLHQNHEQFLHLMTHSIPLSAIAKVSDSASTSEAYVIREYVQEGDASDWKNSTHLKLINTGTIDPWTLLWGEKNIRYLGFKGRYPVVNANWLEQRLPRRYEQALRPTVVVAGMGARLEAAVAPVGVLCGKSTVLIQPNENICPYALSTVLNLELWSEVYKAFFGLRGLGARSMNIGPRQIEQLPMIKREALSPHAVERNEGTVPFNQRLSHWGHQLHAIEAEEDRNLILKQVANHINQCLL